MAPPGRRIQRSLQALRELGPRPVSLYTRYRLGLLSGYYRRQTTSPPKGSSPLALPLLPLPERDALAAVLGDRVETLLEEAREICEGRARLFGGPPVPLRLKPPYPLRHWTEAESAPQGQDVKEYWEPARMGWAFVLSRAYHLNGEETYARTFWELLELFLGENPPYLGLNWTSAQEAALRILALSFAGGVFRESGNSTPERMEALAGAIVAHAVRIPPTLVYARAQQNNHLLTEAAGLYTAARLLPEHPQAQRWRSLGLRWFQRGILEQVAPDGTYSQHSTNYHRLMLHGALWMHALLQGDPEGASLSPKVREKFAAATRWLLTLLDPASGKAPNLGHNDGANILPLAALPYTDFRPVLQAAAAAFLGEQPFEEGPWDEPALWLGLETQQPGRPGVRRFFTQSSVEQAPHMLRAPDGESWAYLRAARFTSRPAHADQLHVDLWWRGLNVAQDAGTYLYNAPPPWENALRDTRVHNTLTLNGGEQMTPSGRFLYLDWAQAEVVEYQRDPAGAWERLRARHDGYRRLGVMHERTLERRGGDWIVTDRVLPLQNAGDRPFQARLHWLLPDWTWEWDGMQFHLNSPHGWVTLAALFLGGEGESTVPLQVRIARAGELLYGEGEAPPTTGWVSPTYGVLEPALSFSLEATARPPCSFQTRWTFSKARGG